MTFLLVISLLSLSLTLSTTSPSPAPTPSPTKFLAPRALTTCAADNCYRAAKSYSEQQYPGYPNLISLCSSYTTPPTVVTTLTSSPLSLPSSCSAPRITSVCDCLVPAAPCATRAAVQRVDNPGFENNQMYPWTFSDTANNAGLTQGDVSKAYQGNGAVIVWSDTSSGIFTATQTSIYLCPNATYLFSAYVGYFYFPGGNSGPVFNSNVTVYFNDQVIVATQPACISQAQCNKPSAAKREGTLSGYRQITASVVAPANANSGFGITLKVVIGRDTSANTDEQYGMATTVDTLLDLITLTKVG